MCYAVYVMLGSGCGGHNTGEIPSSEREFSTEFAIAEQEPYQREFVNEQRDGGKAIASAEDLYRDADRENYGESLQPELHDTHDVEPTPELEPLDREVQPDIVARGEWQAALCSTDMRLISHGQSQIRAVAPPAQTEIDPQPDGAHRCTIEFALTKPKFLQMQLTWRWLSSPTKASPLWLRVNSQIWIDWQPPVDSKAIDVTHQHLVASPTLGDKPLWIWLPQGTHRIVVTWGSPQLALETWQLESVRELPSPPAPQIDPQQWEIPQIPIRANVRDLGAKGDGIADDSQAFQAAIDQVANSGQAGAVFIPAGHYRLRKSIYIRNHGLVMRGEGVRSQIAVELDPKDTTQNSGIIATGQGCEQWLHLSRDATAGSRSLYLDQAHNLQAGDEIELKADDGDEPAPGYSGQKYIRFQIDLLQIRKIQGHEIQVHRPLYLDFPTSRKARICRYRPLTDLGFENFALKSNNDAPINGISVHRAVYPFARELHLSNVSRTGLTFHRVREGRITHSNYRDARHFGDGGHGYGFALISSFDNFVGYNQTVNNRHGIIVSYGAAGNQILANELTRSTLAAIDIHGEYDHHNLVQANWIRNSFEAVIVGGGGFEVHANDGPGNHVIANLIGPEMFFGIRVADLTTDTLLRDNRIFGTKITAIWITTQSHRTSIERNHISGNSVIGIQADADELQILHNILELDPIDTSYAILISEKSKRYQIIGNQLKGNTLIQHPNDPDSTVK